MKTQLERDIDAARQVTYGHRTREEVRAQADKQLVDEVQRVLRRNRFAGFVLGFGVGAAYALILTAGFSKWL